MGSSGEDLNVIDVYTEVNISYTTFVSCPKIGLNVMLKFVSPEELTNTQNSNNAEHAYTIPTGKNVVVKLTPQHFLLILKSGEMSICLDKTEYVTLTTLKPAKTYKKNKINIRLDEEGRSTHDSKGNYQQIQKGGFTKKNCEESSAEDNDEYSIKNTNKTQLSEVEVSSKNQPETKNNGNNDCLNTNCTINENRPFTSKPSSEMLSDSAKTLKGKPEAKDYTCRICGARNKDLFHLQIHSRIHSKEKPFKCNQCDAKFANFDSLHWHKNKHAGIQPCICYICGGRFSSNTSLCTHIKKHEKQNFKHKCAGCDKRFFQKSDLAYHEGTHTGNWPIMCDACGKGFSMNCHFQRHKKICGIVRPVTKKSRRRRNAALPGSLEKADNGMYRCIICNTFLKHIIGGRHHMRRYARSLQCCNCKEVFTTHEEHKGHIESEHGAVMC